MADVIVKASCDQTLVEIYTCPPSDITVINQGGGGGGITNFASREETDAGVILDKALNPDVGAYAYDRFRWVGQHEAGKGTATVTLVPIAGVVTVDQALSNVFDITATENLHFADPVNPILGQTVNISIRQDIVGEHTATWGDKWTFTNKVTPVLSTAPLAVDMVSCQWNETDEVMRCSFLPNFGANYEAPPVIGIEDLNFVNLGGGNEVLKGQVVADVQFRTITGGGDINVSTVDDNIVISYTPPAPTIEVLDDVNDVDTATAAAGDVLTYDGENWVNAAPRRYTVGATWTNGTQEVGTPINEVSCVVSERSQIAKWTILTDGLYGSCQLDVRRVTLGNFPPLSTDTICGGNKPLIAGGFSNEDDALVGWDTVCEEGEILQFVLETTNNFTTVQLLLTMERIP